MPIVGFTFTKFGVEKKPLVSKQVTVSNDLNLGVVELVKRSDYTGSDVAKFNFSFVVKYGDIGNIDLVGYVLYSDDTEKLKKLVGDWEKNKVIPPVLLQQILNAALVKCNIKALELSQDVGLPPHFELPKLQINPAKSPEKKTKN